MRCRKSLAARDTLAQPRTDDVFIWVSGNTRKELQRRYASLVEAHVGLSDDRQLRRDAMGRAKATVEIGRRRNMRIARTPLDGFEHRHGLHRRLIIVHRHDAIGSDRVNARLAAAEALQRILEADRETRPDARRFIVAHSHGGTVALLATRNAALRAALAGVVCLSTPFLQRC